MRKGFGRRVDDVINEADILFEIIDARFAELMRNESLEEKIRARGKKLALILNKSDLAEKKTIE
ncbi:MAG: hypothetical protein ABIA76_01125 [Candidatus Diapherotrites archaeon]